jgi:hypothetical protein
MLKTRIIYTFILSVLLVLALSTIVQAGGRVRPRSNDMPFIPTLNGYVALSNVNSWFTEDPQKRQLIPETFISESFNAGERELLTLAMGYLAAFPTSSSVENCTLKHSNVVEARSNWYSTWPDPNNPPENLRGVLRGLGVAVYRHWDRHILRRRDVPMKLFINRVFDNNKKWAGLAGLGTDIRNEGYQITLNMAKFSQFIPGGGWWSEEGSAIMGQNMATGIKMGGIILHEILHNIGYDHGEVINGNFDPVEGSVPYVAQWCFASAGDHGSARTLRAAGRTWLTGSESWTDPAFYAD